MPIPKKVPTEYVYNRLSPKRCLLNINTNVCFKNSSYRKHAYFSHNPKQHFLKCRDIAPKECLVFTFDKNFPNTIQGFRYQKSCLSNFDFQYYCNEIES